MESRSEAVCISASVAEEMFTEQCSVEEQNGEWQELEQFWGEEKQRLIDLDGQTRPLSNSLEKHLMYDNYLNEPTPKNSLKESFATTENFRIIKGADIKDIPTSYVIGGFEPNELIAIGTYVDKDILPGFQYKVRKNLSDEYLFDGKALTLETIGLGYGKRLTFQGESLNENDNYFWSDSRLHGYGFTLQALSPNSVFTLFDTAVNKDIGRIIVNNPAVLPDTEISTVVLDNGRVEKRVAVTFTCDVVLSSASTQQNVFVEDVSVKGEALLIRDASTKARIDEIVLQDFIMDGCHLLPEE
ncbi:uncharacterized protein TNIN_389871 [Trichonephila inaurata madagascariensis]|uniref:Uncharacterized protein n=1 Tax=Trichonephila inaurata madagascariensis TaxID=2747483 RepID=A0A8X6X797_9ARAC|nr:uncharacterized protein TNIN_389871 [Trichonephila inaurata madagascariensis]